MSGLGEQTWKPVGDLEAVALRTGPDSLPAYRKPRLWSLQMWGVASEGCHWGWRPPGDKRLIPTDSVPAGGQGPQAPHCPLRHSPASANELTERILQVGGPEGHVRQKGETAALGFRCVIMVCIHTGPGQVRTHATGHGMRGQRSLQPRVHCSVWRLHRDH